MCTAIRHYLFAGKRLPVLLLSVLLFAAGAALAQPANDACTNASPITISNGGYGFGLFTSAQHNISAATVQTGETFAPAILVASQTQKSVWYKFSLPTNRSVRVTLAQPPASAITAGDAGFAIYKSNRCLPTNDSLSTKLTPIGLFGSTYHPCVEPGEYLVQVSAKSSANGPVYIELSVLDSSGAAYDHPTNAFQFGLLSATPYVRGVDFDVECQSLEDGNEACLAVGSPAVYSKSTWHTFKTPTYFDYISVLLATPDGGFPTVQKFGYRLYKGDARTIAISALTVVTDCDSLKTQGYYPARKSYRCGALDTSTVYSIQLFYHRDFEDRIRLGIAYDGSGPTQAPEPILANIPVPNKMGVLNYSVGGTNNTATDKFGCNSLHSAHPCAPSLPAQGILRNGIYYNMSSFFTFTLATTSRLDIRSDYIYPSCGNLQYVRLYSQGVSANCNSLDTANIIGQFNGNSGFSINCLPPGNYTIQVMGSDSATALTNNNYSQLYNGHPALCNFGNLGQRFTLSINTFRVKGINKFSLNLPGAVDSIRAVGGVIQPLLNNVTHNAVTDTFGCSNTVLPDTVCSPAIRKKAMYREFAIADSGIVNIEVLGYSNYFNYMLFKGSASALAAAQNVNSFPQKITGLTRYSECKDQFDTYCYGGERVCVIPGNYTFTSFGGDNLIGITDRPTFTASTLNTIHHTPALAQDMGSIIDSVGGNGGSRTSDADYFSCKDNADTINGYAPCVIGGRPSTKAIYRQFYLNAPAIVRINGAYGYCGGYTTPGGFMTLFNGKATDGLNTLTTVADRWKCFQDQSVVNICTPLPAGWYTVVSYGAGPSYGQPLRHVTNGGPMGYSNFVGLKDQFTITVTKACPGPKYNRPYKASVNNGTGQPHLIQWGPRVGHTAAYPKTDTTYVLPTEDFNCTVDTPFSSHPIAACATGLNKVAYYVFRTTQECYLQIDTKGYWAKVYADDVRTDSARYDTLTPIQPCQQTAGYIQLCKVQPGTYTLVIFATSATSCTNVTPTIYIDQLGYSRFDHANNAYDFGLLPPDSLWYSGKVGDVNPLNAGRAASNDFYYCTTGARPNDPATVNCYNTYNANIYNPGVNIPLWTANTNGYEMPRRNLWYTFTADRGGYVRLKVANKTIGKNYIYRFAVYKSNVDATQPFSTIVSTGQVDSTTAQGLTLVANNTTQYWCYNTEAQISFFRNPCTATLERYYVLVECTNSYPAEIPGMKPNSQVELSILIDSINAIQPRFDHYSQAGNFGTVGAGSYIGPTDNFSCATRDATDPVYATLATCTRNVWYKFTTNVTGYVRARMMVGTANGYNYDDIQLFRSIVPGDSTATGLQFQGYSHVYDSGFYWTQSCITPGTYYLLLPGCNRLTENVYPQIKILEQAGDFCSAPVLAPLTGPGVNTATVTVNCHTIGTDYGEFNPLLTCPANTPRNTYKSSWFRIDITGTDTLDVTAFINETTTASSAQIKYRMMTGNCGAMQEQSCVQDALTQNTYKCLVPGSYYMQVFTPVAATGDIQLKLSAIKHADTCAPVNNCLANANFIPQFDCTTGDSVQFVNYSTYGSAIAYSWNFGYNGQTSTAVAPSFFYPALATSATYTATLTTSNTGCSGQNNATAQITIPARPYFRLGRDTALCSPASLVLNATTHAGTTYLWSTGATTPTITVGTSGGVSTYWCRATFNNCIKRDTIKVSVNTIVARRQGKVLCGNDSVQLSSNRGLGETFLWSNGATTNNIYASVPGTYYCDISLYGCIKRDTFNVTGIVYPFTADSLQACFAPGRPYVLNATTPGAISYSWQNGSGSPTFNVTTAGLYWVNVNFGTCSVRDTIKLSNLQALRRIDSIPICAGQSYTLPSGTVVNAAGIYNDTLRNAVGCDSLISRITLAVQPVVRTNGVASICQGQSYTLPWGTSVNTSGIYRDTLRSTRGCDSLIRSVTVSLYTATAATFSPTICAGQTYTLPSGITVSNSGTYRDTLRYVYGCDSLITTVNLQVRAVATAAQNPVICTGQSYILPSGVVVNTAGIYRDTLRYASGCDSIRYTVNVTVRPIVSTVANATICTGQSYTLPGGQVVTASGVYKDTLHYQAGCDSLISTINISVRNVATQTVPVTICAGQSYTLPSGAVVTTGGTYRDTLRYATGNCDSLITTVNLQLRTVAVATQNPVICAGQTYTLPTGAVVNASGTYRDTLRYTAGCDSVRFTVNLTVRQVAAVSVNPIICAGQTYTLPGGQVITASGVYRDTLRYQSGCDSLISTISLTVRNAAIQTLSPVICAGQTYTLPNGQAVSVGGTYRDTLRYANSNCDSLITTINLQVRTVSNATQNPVICAGQSYTLPNGTVINAAGLYRDTLRYASGCDSIRYTINLAVRTVAIANTNAAICAGQSYTLPGGQVVNASGVYRDTLRYQSANCDSLISTTNLTVRAVTRQAMPAIICAGQSYTLPSGITVNASGTYRDTLRYQSSTCDSLITTLNLTVRSVTSRTMAATICAEQSYTMPGGAIVTANGVYRDTIRYINPVCDSMITSVTLTVRPVTVTSISPSICGGQNYMLPSGATVSAAGIYRDTLRYTNGCDSLRITVTLSVKTVARLNAIASICNGQTFALPSGIVVNAAGTYRDTLHYVSGCDSVINTITLKVNTATRVNSNATVCQGQVYTLPWGATAATAGIYRDTTRATAGCDSIITSVTLAITPRPAMGITPPVTSVCQGDSLQLKAYGGTTYRWVQGNGILSPASATTFIYPPQAGRYRVAIYDAVCNRTDTFQSVVSIDPLPQISLTKSNDVTCMQGSAQLTATGGSRYKWSPATGLNNAGASNPIAAPAATTMYYVQAISNKNCTTQDSIEVKVIKGDAGNGFLVPSAFTPDGDGKNDCFSIRSWGAVTDVRFNVYNRYGLLVFTTADPAKCWDGTYKGEVLAPAAFVYIISANTVCGPVNRKGTVVLIR